MSDEPEPDGYLPNEPRLRTRIIAAVIVAIICLIGWILVIIAKAQRAF
jgi:hypothetical protein